MAFLSGLMAVTIMLLICYLVVMRYFFVNPPAWIIEVCEYLLLYLTFFGAAWLLKNDGHVTVDLAINALPVKMRRIMHVLTTAVGTVAWCILTVAGIWVTWNNYSRGILSIQAISVPKWILLAAIPYGSLLLAVQSFRHFVRAVQQIKKKQAY